MVDPDPLLCALKLREVGHLMSGVLQKLPCLGVGDRGGTGRRGGHLCGSRIVHDGFGDTGCPVSLVTDSSLTHICLLILCSSSLSRQPGPTQLHAADSAASLELPLFAAKPPGWDPAMPLVSVFLACLTSGLDPVLTSRQYYSSRRHAEILEAPNYVWHHLLPFSGCPELYMQYVLEDVQ